MFRIDVGYRIDVGENHYTKSKRTVIKNIMKGGGGMQTENLNLKRSLVVQSFAPLFLLLTIKHMNFDLYWNLICKFIDIFTQNGLSASLTAIHHASFGGLVV